MADKFDEFSKHLARKQTRRGALKFLGAGLIGAFASTVFSREVDADGWRRRRHYSSFVFNGTSPWEDYKDKIPTLNYTLPDFNYTLPDFNHTIPDYKDKIPTLNETLPHFNYTLPDFDNKSSVLDLILRYLGRK